MALATAPTQRVGRRQGGKGKPFGPGNCANPKGRPRKTQEQREVEAAIVDAQQYAKGFRREAVDKLVELMRGRCVIGVDGEGRKKYGPASATVQKDAAIELINRGHGTPRQSVDVKSEEVIVHVGGDDLIERLVAELLASASGSESCPASP